MGKVLVIGAGGVGTVVVHKMASLPEVYTEIMLASRTKSKCDAIADKIGGNRVQTAAVDADNVPQLVALIRSFKPDLVVNVALPYQDLHIMDACLETGVAYLDTANYEPPEEANLNTAGSGLTRTGTRKQVLQLFLVADLTRGLLQFLQLMQQNIILMRSIISTLLIVTPVTMENLLPQTSIPRSISGKLLRRVNTGKMVNG